MIGAHQPQRKSRARLITALRWAAALAVFAILFHFFPVAQLRAALASVPAIRFAIILIVYLCAHAIGIFKWRMVVNAAGSQLDFATSAQCYLGGLFGTLFLPSIVGGDVIRLAVGLGRSPPPAGVLAGNMVDRFLDVMAQAGLVLLGLILLPGSVPQNLQETARKALLLCIAGIVILVALAIVLRRAVWAGGSVRFRRRLARLRHALRSVSRRPRTLLFGWLAGTFIQATFLILT